MMEHQNTMQLSPTPGGEQTLATACCLFLLSVQHVLKPSKQAKNLTTDMMLTQQQHKPSIQFLNQKETNLKCSTEKTD